jgi:hypothetical protein
MKRQTLLKIVICITVTLASALANHSRPPARSSLGPTYLRTTNNITLASVRATGLAQADEHGCLDYEAGQIG